MDPTNPFPQLTDTLSRAIELITLGQATSVGEALDILQAIIVIGLTASGAAVLLTGGAGGMRLFAQAIKFLIIAGVVANFAPLMGMILNEAVMRGSAFGGYQFGLDVLSAPHLIMYMAAQQAQAILDHIYRISGLTTFFPRIGEIAGYIACAYGIMIVAFILALRGAWVLGQALAVAGLAIYGLVVGAASGTAFLAEGAVRYAVGSFAQVFLIAVILALVFASSNAFIMTEEPAFWHAVGALLAIVFFGVLAWVCGSSVQSYFSGAPGLGFRNALSYALAAGRGHGRAGYHLTRAGGRAALTTAAGGAAAGFVAYQGARLTYQTAAAVGTTVAAGSDASAGVSSGPASPAVTGGNFSAAVQAVRGGTSVAPVPPAAGSPPRGAFSPGERVIASDRGNIGVVEASGNARSRVTFTNPDTGATATKTLPNSQLRRK